jgi:hypothetical protein
LVPPIKHTAKDNKERKNKRMSDIVELNREKLKAVFVKIDQNGNGLMERFFSHTYSVNSLKFKVPEPSLSASKKAFLNPLTHSADVVSSMTYLEKYIAN